MPSDAPRRGAARITAGLPAGRAPIREGIPEPVFRDTTPQDAKNLKFDPQRPAIKWYASHKDDKNVFKSCRSELLRNFQKELLAYYNGVFGDATVQQQYYLMDEIVPMSQPGDHTENTSPAKGYGYNEKTNEGTGLYLKLLDQVGVLDLRQKDVLTPNQNNFQEYVDFLNTHYGKFLIRFTEIEREHLAATTKPVLVLQDVEKHLFDSEEKNNEGEVVKPAGFLFESGIFDDAKKTLYGEFAHLVPMQTLNINLNNAAKYNSADGYFDYPVFKLEDYKHRLDVCLNELLLKKYIVHQLPVKNIDKPNHSLPCILSIKSLTNFAYMYQNTFMYVDEKYILQFLDLDNPSEKQIKNDFLQKLNIDWFAFDKQFAQRNYTRDDNGQNKAPLVKGKSKDRQEEKLKTTHLVFAKDLVLAIEDTENRVLFKTEATKTSESQRIKESITALEGIYFSETESENIYTVGESQGMNTSMDKSIKIRRLHYYQKNDNFKIHDLLQTLSVQFVRNKRYTVYPYFFDLLNLYRKDVRQTDLEE